MRNQIFTTMVLFTTFVSVYTQNTTGYSLPLMKKKMGIRRLIIIRVACPRQGDLSAKIADSMNLALVSAYSSFEKNPAYSSANAQFSSAMDSFPASVTSSLYCSGYGGVDINSLPTWLTAVPTAVVSIILQEEGVYQSIVSSFEEEAKVSMTSSASTSTPQSTISPSSSLITTTGISASASSPANVATPTPSSAASAGTSGSLASSILAAAGLILAILL